MTFRELVAGIPPECHPIFFYSINCIWRTPMHVMMATTMPTMRIMRLLRLSGDPPVPPLTSFNHPWRRSHSYSVHNWLRFEHWALLLSSQLWFHPAVQWLIAGVERADRLSQMLPLSTYRQTLFTHRPPNSPLLTPCHLVSHLTRLSRDVVTLRHVVWFTWVMNYFDFRKKKNRILGGKIRFWEKFRFLENFIFSDKFQIFGEKN